MSDGKLHVDRSDSAVGRFAMRHPKTIVLVCIVLCLAGGYAALEMPSAIFPQTDFPRVVILVDNGVMPGDEMMARVTRPIEEAMKDIPGAVSIRSATGRGSAEINVFFDWSVDMVRSELYVLGRLAEIRATLPESAVTSVWRLTFSAFPILGISLTSDRAGVMELWETARYELKPRFLRIPGVARVDLVGGRAPEFGLIVDPLKLQALGSSLTEVAEALAASNRIEPAGMLEERHTLYLTVVDGRLTDRQSIEELTLRVGRGRVVRVADFARVERSPEPVFNIVTADGKDAVLLNVRSQPDGSTLAIAGRMRAELRALRDELPPDMKLAFFYDQSERVVESVDSVRDAILFGLLLSVLILYAFLKNWRVTTVAILVIPVTILITLVAMRLVHMSFNLMTLGGIAAAIGLVIDDAIVVVDAIHAKIVEGFPRERVVPAAMTEILHPLVGSTLTPVVVFLPLAFLVGVAGVFFRALALTMAVSLLASLALAVTLTPALASWLLPTRENLTHGHAPATRGEGPLMRLVQRGYAHALRQALRFRWVTLGVSLIVLLAGIWIYLSMPSEFLPPMDEGGFVIDYHAPWGTSLTETNRQLEIAEAILHATPEVESYSRRTGARLALAIAEPNTGDFLVKLRRDRARTTADVISALRERFERAVPGMEWEFPGILGDLIGDLTWSPSPIEVKLFSNDTALLKRKGPEIRALLDEIPGVVDTFDGLVLAGPSVSVRVRHTDAQRFGLSAESVGAEVNAAMLGQVSSSILQGDRLIDVRVTADAREVSSIEQLGTLPIRSTDGHTIQLAQVADVTLEPGALELRREDLRQDIAVTARLEGRDLGGAIREIRERIAESPGFSGDDIEFGGLYRQQQESFYNLALVLLTAILLVYIVLVAEFRGYRAPLAILVGSVLSLFGALLALRVTGSSLNIVSLLGAIIGVGIVAKNGILMLDSVEYYRQTRATLPLALAEAGARRLRPVMMTSLAAALGMLPLAYGIGAGADMLKPLAIGVMGALAISVLLSLVATPVFYSLMQARDGK